MKSIMPFLLCDFYKVGHPFQYPENTTLVYSNLTPRSSRIPGVDKMVFFGLNYFIKEYLIKMFNEEFFQKPKTELLNEYKRIIETGLSGPLPSYEHIEKLHDLGYLPLLIKALPEGSKVEMRVPCLTIRNTHPGFAWLTNFFETIMSALIWQSCTSATIAHEYRKIFDNWSHKTGFPKEIVPFQGHDFSFRGMSSYESSCLSGAGHLLSFSGTDTIPAILFLENYYGAKGFIGGSIPATEHSVMCAGGQEGELATFKHLITEVYPKGFVSIVSDTWNLWTVINKTLPALKETIMKRDGKVVIRPDSGKPEDIIAGYKIYTKSFARFDDVPVGELLQMGYSAVNIDHSGTVALRTKTLLTDSEIKGVIECLWDIFGGTRTDKGYKLLDSHVGAIYGDSITLPIAQEICKRLADKEFASQCIFGIGSYTYQYNTRDTFGLAMKATYVEVGEGESKKCINIFKSPITDNGIKKSAKGLLRVDDIGVVPPQLGFRHTHFHLTEEVDWNEEERGALKPVFENGKLLVDPTLDEIRKRLNLL